MGTQWPHANGEGRGAGWSTGAGIAAEGGSEATARKSATRPRDDMMALLCYRRARCEARREKPRRY